MVCLLHEKPFAGVNGSGKHNNWSMGDRRRRATCWSPGDTPARQRPVPGLLRRGDPGGQQAPGPAARLGRQLGNDHRLGANEAPPAIISIFLGSELEDVFDAIAKGEGDPHTPASFLELGATMLPPLPKHAGDRNRT